MPNFFKIYRYFGLVMDFLFFLGFGMTVVDFLRLDYYYDLSIFIIILGIMVILLSSIYLIIKTFRFGQIRSAHEIDSLLDKNEEAYYTRFKFDKFVAFINVLLGLLFCLLVFTPDFVTLSGDDFENMPLIFLGIAFLFFTYGASKMAYSVWVLNKLNKISINSKSATTSN